jgi:hypothetical protein
MHKMSEDVEDMIFKHRCIISKLDTPLTIAVYRRRYAGIWSLMNLQNSSANNVDNRAYYDGLVSTA